MKTQRYLITALCCSVLVLASAQNIAAQGFYFNAGGGYNFNATNISYVNLCPGFEQTYVIYNYPNTTPFAFVGANQSYSETSGNNGTNYTNTFQALNKGFGGGANFFVSAGYNFNPYLSAELGFSYLPGTTIQSTYTEQDNYLVDLNEYEITNETLIDKLTSSPLCRLMPTVKFSFPLSKFTPYLKAGLIVGMGAKVTIGNIYSSTEADIVNGTTVYGTPEMDNMALTASGGLSLGYTGSIGVEYKISNSFSVYAEFNIISESWSPTQGDITSFYESGATPPYVLSSSQFTYSDNITTGGPGNNGNANNVIEINSQYPKQTFSFSSYGFAIGIKFSIFKEAATPAPAKTNQ